MPSAFPKFRRLLAATLIVTGVIGGVHAQTAPSKLATDLQLAVAGQPMKTNWVKDGSGKRWVKVLIVTDGSDPDMVSLRAQVLAAGGSVYYRYQSVAAISAMLPTSQIGAIAARPDVQSLSPNRMTARTVSTLEATTGTAGVRGLSGTGYTRLDGTGVGIAVLDSGIAWSHKNFSGADGRTSRVARAVNMLKIGDSSALKSKDWSPGVDVSDAIYPGIGSSKTATKFESDITTTGGSLNDQYGHGTHVASAAAARGNYQLLRDSTGVAPNASLYDVRVLDGNGYGQLSDVLAGIDWVIYHAKELNIRVMNLSLASSSTESYLTDPFCRAVRSAVASGITVVVAAGNYGQDSATGGENFGTIGAPGNEPSVITVGSANMRGTILRRDDTVNFFSSRGPTRGGLLVNGVRQPDNLIKPDLVAPGNRIVGAVAADKSGGLSSWASLPKLNASLSLPYGGVLQFNNQALMELSGTSIAAPVVAGTAALMLQANPGLTPPLIKALMQYSAQPLANANILQQGAGLLNVDGSVQLARALRTDLSKAIAAGTIKPGDSMVAAAKVLPAPSTTVYGVRFNWGRMIVAGGNNIFSGSLLVSAYQPIYDPKLLWAGETAKRLTVNYWPAASGETPQLWFKNVTEGPAVEQVFVTPGVVLGSDLAGVTSYAGKTGLFMPTSTLSAWLASGSGMVMSEGVRVSKGMVLSEGIRRTAGMVLSEGLVLSEGFVLREGMVLSEGFVLSESGQMPLQSATPKVQFGEN